MQKYLEMASEQLSILSGIDKSIITLILISLEIILLIAIIKIIMKNIYARINVDDKKKFVYNKKMQLILNVATVILIIFVWGEQLRNIMTLISFVSAAVTIALREIIFNFFAGLYIKFNKPFVLEDRIEIGEIKGDVINLHGLGFEILEIGERNEGEQSTGRIIHIPNSEIFVKPLKNYVKAFKYIWDEIEVNVKMTADIEKSKELLYKILRENETLKETPQKMEDALDDVKVDYRIYFNNLKPIIYSQIKENYVQLSVRFLVHPKKARNVEDEISEKILEEFKNGNIDLYETV